MSHIIEMQLDHAVQVVTNSSSGTVSRTTVNSGNLYVGYDPVENYDRAYFGNRYSFELYFNIPDKSYEYIWSYGKISNDNHSGVQQVNFKYVSSYGTGYGKHTTTSYASGTRSSQMLPTGPSITGITFSDSDIAYMQYCDSKQIKVTYSYTPPDEYTTKNEYSGVEYTWTYRYTDKITYTNIQNITLSYTLNDISLIINPTYPVDVYARNDRNCVFAWEARNSTSRSTLYLDFTSYQVDIYKADGTLLITKSGDEKAYSVTITPDDFNGVVGELKYTIHLTTNYDYLEKTTDFYSFIVTGETNAPDIESISQNSFPTVTWSCASQISWQMIIKNANEVIYDSGMKNGSDKSFKVPVFLEDGFYSIEMRALNEFGIYTAWSSESFKLEPTKPSAPTSIIVSTNNDFSVDVDCTVPEDAGILYVMRRKDSDSKPEIIGQYTKRFRTYKVPLNANYEYAVRNYVEGYSDTDWKDATVITKGVVIRDAENLENFVYVWMSENETMDIITNTSRSDTLLQCVGRTYPIAEVGEWITSTRNFTGFVSESDYIKLRKMKANVKNVIFQNTDEAIPCYIEITDSGSYVSGGRIVDFSLTRIDGD